MAQPLGTACQLGTAMAPDWEVNGSGKGKKKKREINFPLFAMIRGMW